MMRIWPLIWMAMLGLLDTPAHAQTALERIEPRLSRAIEQYRVLLTCSSAEVSNSTLAQRIWTTMIAAARENLVAQNASPGDLAAFDKRTARDAVMLPQDTPLSRIIPFCTQENREWLRLWEDGAFLSRIDETPP